MKKGVGTIGLLLLGLVASLLVLRQFAPGLLESRGLYLGKAGYQPQAEAQNAALPMQYVDSHFCQQCHQFQHDEWQESQHSSVACETCHGPSSTHLEGNAIPSLYASREACGVCHDELASRPAGFPQVSLAEHYPQSACVACHDPKGPSRYIPHPVQGNSDCLLCHRPQGPVYLPDNHLGYPGESCQTCHWSKTP